MLTGLFYVLSGYLLGSILFANIFSKLFHKDIISRSPDANYGTANAFRYGGPLCGILTLLMDMAKGFLPVFLYMQTPEPSEVMLPFVLAAPVIGHILPVFSKFNGGKAIAVTFGSLAGMFPNWTTVLTLCFFFVLFMTVIRIKPHSICTITSYVCTTFVSFIIEDVTAVSVGMLIITIACSIKMLSVPEEREKFEITLIKKR